MFEFSLPDAIGTTKFVGSSALLLPLLEFSLPSADLPTRCSNSHYWALISLPGLRILTGYSNSHYQAIISLPTLRILNTGRCSHHQNLIILGRTLISPSHKFHYRALISLPDLRLISLQIFEFSIPGRTTRSSDSHYWAMISLADLRILTTGRWSHYNILYQIFEFSLQDLRIRNIRVLISLLDLQSNSHYRALISLQLCAFSVSVLAAALTTRVFFLMPDLKR